MLAYAVGALTAAIPASSMATLWRGKIATLELGARGWLGV